MTRREVRELGLTAMKAGVASPEELETLIVKVIIYEARLQLLADIVREDPVDVASVRIVVNQAIKSGRFGGL